MKRALFLLASVVMLSAAVTACNATVATSSPGTSAARPSLTVSTLSPTTSQPAVSPTASANIDYAALGMSPQQVRQWEQQGTASVDTPDGASVLAGFNVITPSYWPQSLLPGSKYIVKTNAPMLKQTGSNAPPDVTVEQVWSVPGKAVAIIFIQSSRPFSHANGTATPTPMCGITVQTGTEPHGTSAMSGGRFFHWEQNGITCDLTGVTSSALSGADLENIVCSIINP